MQWKVLGSFTQPWSHMATPEEHSLISENRECDMNKEEKGWEGGGVWGAQEE